MPPLFQWPIFETSSCDLGEQLAYRADKPILSKRQQVFEADETREWGAEGERQETALLTPVEARSWTSGPAV